MVGGRVVRIQSDGLLKRLIRPCPVPLIDKPLVPKRRECFRQRAVQLQGLNSRFSTFGVGLLRCHVAAAQNHVSVCKACISGRELGIYLGGTLEVFQRLVGVRARALAPVEAAELVIAVSIGVHIAVSPQAGWSARPSKLLEEGCETA